jgi:asparagine synthase (glutamine-hydrolysing)
MCGIFFVDNAVQTFKTNGMKLQHRGPDNTRDLIVPNEAYFMFHRLSIHGLTSLGDQPLKKHNYILLCNGEIYNYKLLANHFSNDDYTHKSDCEVILELFHKIADRKLVCNLLDGVFAFVLKDVENGTVFAARDPIGVRPLFMGWYNDSVCFASEMKALVDMCINIREFPPGHFYCNGQLVKYHTITAEVANSECSYETLRNLFTAAVEKRLDSERPVGFFLSGGLDSSLVCSVATRILNRRINTFSIGIGESPDMKNARVVSDYLNTKHNEIYFTTEQALDALENVIYQLESYDCTTIRASVPMYIMSEYVSKNTDFKVILSGEGADELFGGYLYFHDAPSVDEFQNETQRLLEHVHKYDVLRADRCTAGHGLELRVPFFDKEFRKYISSISPYFKKTALEKKILRDAFVGYLPENILHRQKNGMSDAVGYSWVDFIRKYAEKQVSNEEFAMRSYDNNNPLSKEEYYYRKIYEKFFGKIDNLPHVWRPKYTTVKDPSARLLNSFDQ